MEVAIRKTLTVMMHIKGQSLQAKMRQDKRTSAAAIVPAGHSAKLSCCRFKKASPPRFAASQSQSASRALPEAAPSRSRRQRPRSLSFACQLQMMRQRRPRSAMQLHASVERVCQLGVGTWCANGMCAVQGQRVSRERRHVHCPDSNARFGTTLGALCNCRC